MLLFKVCILHSQLLYQKHGYDSDCTIMFNHLSTATQTKILLLFALGDGHHC